MRGDDFARLWGGRHHRADSDSGAGRGGPIGYYTHDPLDPNLERIDMNNRNTPINPWKVAVGGLLVLLLCLVVLFGFLALTKTYSRYQRRADANNNVKVVNINIRKAQQQARVVAAQNATIKARAQQRFLEAVGIRRAQDEISSTLTPLYIQHEAIQAQEKVATSGQNNTIIYTPSGSNGVPLVQTPPLTPHPQK